MEGKRVTANAERRVGTHISTARTVVWLVSSLQQRGTAAESDRHRRTILPTSAARQMGHRTVVRAALWGAFLAALFAEHAARAYMAPWNTEPDYHAYGTNLIVQKGGSIGENAACPGTNFLKRNLFA